MSDIPKQSHTGKLPPQTKYIAAIVTGLTLGITLLLIDQVSRYHRAHTSQIALIDKTISARILALEKKQSAQSPEVQLRTIAEQVTLAVLDDVFNANPPLPVPTRALERRPAIASQTTQQPTQLLAAPLTKAALKTAAPNTIALAQAAPKKPEEQLAAESPVMFFFPRSNKRSLINE